MKVHILALPDRKQNRWEPVVAQLLKAVEQGSDWSFFERLAFSSALHDAEGVGPRREPRDKKEAWEAKRASAKRPKK